MMTQATTERELEALSEQFDKQFPDCSIGGFCNPTFVCENETIIEFRCFYDNYEDEEDSWTWYWVKKTKQFCN